MNRFLEATYNFRSINTLLPFVFHSFFHYFTFFHFAYFASHRQNAHMKCIFRWKSIIFYVFMANRTRLFQFMKWFSFQSEYGMHERERGGMLCVCENVTRDKYNSHALAILVNKEAQYIKPQSIIELNVKCEWIKEWLISRVTPCRSTFHFFEKEISVSSPHDLYNFIPLFLLYVLCTVLLCRQINGIYSYQTIHTVILLPDTPNRFKNNNTHVLFHWHFVHTFPYFCRFEFMQL